MIGKCHNYVDHFLSTSCLPGSRTLALPSGILMVTSDSGRRCPTFLASATTLLRDLVAARKGERRLLKYPLCPSGVIRVRGSACSSS